jgi:hypothetical protein
MAQLVKYRTINGTAPRIPIQDVVLNMSRVISVSTESKTGRGVMVYENDQGPVTIYTSEVASYTKSKMTGYVNAIMLKYNVYKGERDQYFVVDNIVYAIKTPSDPTNLTDIYILDDTSQLVNKITIEAPIQVLIADANQISFTGATWGYIGGDISDQLDLQSQFSTKADKSTTLTINGTTYDLSANRSWTIGTGVAIGDSIGSGVANNVLFIGAGELLAQDSLFKFDATTKRLGIGTATPLTTAHFVGGISGTIGTQIARLEGSLPELWFKDTSDNSGFSISKYGNQVYFVNTNSSGAYSRYTGMMELSSGSWTIGSGSNPLARLFVDGYTGGGGVDFYVKANNGTTIVSVFKGATAQSKNLTEWHSVATTPGINPVAYVDVSGNANFIGQVGVDQLYFNHSGAGAYILNSANGRLTLYNNAANGFDRLQFGGTTSSFPSLKRSSAELQARLADDSDYAANQSLYLRYGTGSPESVVSAPIGAIYGRTDVGAGTYLYSKQSGSGTTGWVAIGSGLNYFEESFTTTPTPDLALWSAKNAATANISIALIPKGNGGLIMNNPDSTATGGNNRGFYSIDLQMGRTSASEVTSGDRSSILGGYSNTASGGHSAVIGGMGNIAEGIYSSAYGNYSYAYLKGQKALASGRFASTGDTQESMVNLFRSATLNSGDLIELLIGSTVVYAVPQGSNRVWSVIAKCTAVCTADPDGVVAVGSAYTATYILGFKRIGGTVSMVGTADLIYENEDAPMADSDFIFSAGASNNLKIEFQAPVLASDNTFRSNCTLFITEIAY